MWRKILLVFYSMTIFDDVSMQQSQTCFCAPQGFCNNNNINNNNNNGFPNNNNNNGFPNNNNNFPNNNNGNNNNGFPNNNNNNNGFPNNNNNMNNNNGFPNNNNNNNNMNNGGDPNLDVRMANQVASRQGNFGTSQQLTSPVLLQTNVFINQNSAQECSNAGNLQLCCPMQGYQCGMRFPPPNNARIPQPGQSAYNAHPWLALILRQGSNFFYATGAIIDDRHVLTAAHKINESYYNPNIPMQVSSGIWDITQQNEFYPSQTYQVMNTFFHPQYQPINLKNDVAIVRISQSFQLGLYPNTGTVCLPQAPIQPNFMNSLRCYVAGYGATSMIGNNQNQQKEIEVPLMEPNQCQNNLRMTRLGPNFILDQQSFICAGGEAGSDSCKGDGGAPLVCQIANQWYVIGLVAWGISCGQANVPGVYVNVASYTTWIQQIVRS